MLKNQNPPKLTRLECGVYVRDDDPGEPGTHAQRWSVNDAEGELLGAFCKDKTVLEIGTGLGVSTDYLAKYARRVYTYDVDQWVVDNIYPTLNAPNVTCLKSIEDAPMCDVAFIDGLHTTEQVEQDTLCVIPKLQGNWTILYHDAKIASVRNGARRVFNKWTVLNTFAGVGLVTKKDLRDANELQ